MRKYIIFANCALVIVVIFLGMKSYDSVKELSQRKKMDIPIKHSKVEYSKTLRHSRTSFLAGASHPVNYYNVIPKKDLFRPEREEYNEESLSIEKKEASTVKKNIPMPAVDLYGIMIDKKKRVALLYDKREKEKNLRYKVVSIGAEIQGYTLVRIETDQIIVEKDGNTATILLNQVKAARGGVMVTKQKVRKIIGIEKEKMKQTGTTKTGQPIKIFPGIEHSKSDAFKIQKEGAATTAIDKKDIPRGVPFIVQEGNVKYRVIKTPVGEKKVRIN